MGANISIDKLIVEISITINKNANAAVKKVTKTLTAAEKQAQKAAETYKKLGKVLMSAGLSALFTGMAIKNLAQKILTSLVTAFVAARSEGDFLVNKLLSISAAFEFLKFAIFDAFANTDMFIGVVDFLVNFLNWISSIIAKHPALAAFIVLFTGIAIAGGALLMVLGQTGLALLGLISLAEFFGITSVGAFAAATGSALAFIAALAAVIVVGAFIIIFWEEIKTATILQFKKIGAFLKFWWANFKNNIGVIGDLFKLMWYNIKKVAIEALDGVLQKAISIINKMINAFNAINPFGNIENIKFEGLDTTGVTADIDRVTKSMNDRLLAAEELKRLYDVEQGQLSYQLLVNKQAADEKMLGFLGQGTAEKETSTTADAPAETGGTTNIFNIDNSNGDDSKLEMSISSILQGYSNENLGSPNGS
jgi:hypothetical protein